MLQRMYRLVNVAHQCAFLIIIITREKQNPIQVIRFIVFNRWYKASEKKPELP